MRELDTESPVVWPAWCYTGEVSAESSSAGGPRCDRGESADLASRSADANDEAPRAGQAAASTRAGDNLAANTAAAGALDARGASPQGAITHLAAATTPRPPRGRRRAHQNQNGIDAAQVKTERLTPDNNSTSSRSVTPSSSGHPGTPPNATSLGGPEGPAGGGGGGGTPAHHLKHMEQMMGRNYSDFMRSLAAKYNNSNPNDYFSSSRNGYPAGLDPRFAGFKSAAAPFVGLMAPLGAAAAAAAGPQPPQAQPSGGASALGAKEPKEPKQPEQTGGATTTAAGVGGGLFASPANLFPPMLDMSSTQALLHMVRTANAAQSAAELESYLKGANKREAGLSSPLDLSSPSTLPSGFAPRKRARATEARRPDSVSPKPNKMPALGAGGGAGAAPATSPTTPVAPFAAAAQTPAGQGTGLRPASPAAVRCPSLCGHMPCGDGQAVNRWTVEDVVSYVSSIDVCAEYAQNFREHRIDGASLPLLSEEHLTGPIGMKLGPALKLRVLLARKLGACTVCLHCAHCHQQQSALQPGLMTSLPAAAAAAAAAVAAAQHHQPNRRSSASAN